MRLRSKIDYLKDTEKKIQEIGQGNTDIKNISDMGGMSVVAAARIMS